MPKISKKQLEQFQEVTLDGFVVSGSVSAFEYGLDGDTCCVVCGARITYIFVTSHGPMGGDCLATITGDDSTRKEVKSVLKKLNQQFREYRSITIEPALSLKNHSAIWAEFDSDFNSGTYSRCIEVCSEKAAKFAVAAFASEHNIRVYGIV